MRLSSPCFAALQHRTLHHWHIVTLDIHCCGFFHCDTRRNKRSWVQFKLSEAWCATTHTHFRHLLRRAMAVMQGCRHRHVYRPQRGYVSAVPATRSSHQQHLSRVHHHAWCQLKAQTKRLHNNTCPNLDRVLQPITPLLAFSLPLFQPPFTRGQAEISPPPLLPRSPLGSFLIPLSSRLFPPIAFVSSRLLDFRCPYSPQENHVPGIWTVLRRFLSECTARNPPQGVSSVLSKASVSHSSGVLFLCHSDWHAIHTMYWDTAAGSFRLVSFSTSNFLVES